MFNTLNTQEIKQQIPSLLLPFTDQTRTKPVYEKCHKLRFIERLTNIFDCEAIDIKKFDKVYFAFQGELDLYKLQPYIDILRSVNCQNDSYKIVTSVTEVISDATNYCYRQANLALERFIFYNMSEKNELLYNTYVAKSILHFIKTSRFVVIFVDLDKLDNFQKANNELMILLGKSHKIDYLNGLNIYFVQLFDSGDRY